MGGCSTYQIRKIYAIGQALGIVNRGGEDALHDLVYGVTGKSSVKELSYSEACKVIGELEARQGTPPPRPKKTNHRKRKPGGVSEGQERKVWALMYRLAAASPSTVAVGDRLRAAIKKEAGVDALPMTVRVAGLQELQQADRGAEGIRQKRGAKGGCCGWMKSCRNGLSNV